MARMTGIGGVFFKSTSDHKRLAAWYRDNLGIALEDWGGAILKWPEDQAEDRGLTVWHVAERESKYLDRLNRGPLWHSGVALLTPH